MVGLEDDPFLLGFGNFSGVNSLLNFGGVMKFIHRGERIDGGFHQFQVRWRFGGHDWATNSRNSSGGQRHENPFQVVYISYWSNFSIGLEA